MSLIIASPVPAPAPRSFNFKKLFAIIILAFIAASFGAVVFKALTAAPAVTVKRCLSCPNCACPPYLGGSRCACPR
jgi:hypothetical protein